MDKEKLIIRYDGPALDQHRIDVDLLAPALISLSTLLKESNKIINGDTSSIKVLIDAEIEANCVTLSFDIIQSAKETWEVIKPLLEEENIAAVKTLLEWIFLGTGVLGFLKWLGKKQPDNTPIIINQQVNIYLQNHVDIRIENKTNLLKLLNSRAILQSTQGLISPLVKEKGIENVAFKYAEKTADINKEEAKQISSLHYEKNEDDEEPQSIVGHLIVHSTIFDSKAKFWKFKYNGRVEQIDISDTSIAADTIKRGKVVIGDTYKVKLSITEKKTDKGYKYTYKVIKVLDFVPGDEQMDLTLNKN